LSFPGFLISLIIQRVNDYNQEKEIEKAPLRPFSQTKATLENSYVYCLLVIKVHHANKKKEEQG